MSKVISLDNLQRFKNKWVDPLAERIANLEECIIGDDSLDYTYLSDSAIPTNVSGNPIIESAGTDLKDIKGNSVVVNQYARELNSNYYEASDGSVSFSANVASLLVSANGGRLKPKSPNLIQFVSNHIYLAFARIKLTTGTTLVYLETGLADVSVATTNTTQWQNLILKYTWTGTSSSFTYPIIMDKRTSGWDIIQVKDFQLIDLTQWFGATANIPTDLTNDTSLFFAKYYTKSDYIAYNTGSLESSQPTGFDSIGFNQWDEQWELRDNIYVKNKNNIYVIPNTTYYFKIGYFTTNAQVLRVMAYDSSNSFIMYLGTSLNSSGWGYPNATFTTPTNCAYIKFEIYTDYGTNYNHDICINISNASLNGTYKPYVKHSYPLTLPILRSAGSVQDDCKKVRIGSYTFTGQENWVSYGSGYRTSVLTNQAKTVAYNVAPNMISNTGLDVISRTEVNNGTSGISCFEDNVVVSSTTGLTGKTIYYELATPTDQPAITLPEDIAIEKGGTLQASYDNSNQVPADFDFEVAVYKPMQ